MQMDTMYIIKSGDLRYTKGGGCDGGRSGFSAKISLKTAHKMGKLVTAEKFLAQQQQWAQNNVDNCMKSEPWGDWYTPERIAAQLVDARKQLVLWKAARVAEVKLVEA
jgi:hypothetical protein